MGRGATVAIFLGKTGIFSNRMLEKFENSLRKNEKVSMNGKGYTLDTLPPPGRSHP
jgi:hypothetical protein